MEITTFPLGLYIQCTFVEYKNKFIDCFWVQKSHCKLKLPSKKIQDLFRLQIFLCLH